MLELARLKPAHYPYLLESATSPANQQARFSLLLAQPSRVIEGKDFLAQFDAEFASAKQKGGKAQKGGRARGKNAQAKQTQLPFEGGWFVYLGYELAGQIEPVLRLPASPFALPMALAVRCHSAVICDHLSHKLFAVSETKQGLGTLVADVAGLASHCGIGTEGIGARGIGTGGIGKGAGTGAGAGMGAGSETDSSAKLGARAGLSSTTDGSKVGSDGAGSEAKTGSQRGARTASGAGTSSKVGAGADGAGSAIGFSGAGSGVGFSGVGSGVISKGEPLLERRRLTEAKPADYLEALARCKAYIYAGDIFQANLSRAWEAELDPAITHWEVYNRLRRVNPAPFAALAQFGNQFGEDCAVISSSPERLVKVENNRIHTRPIAGTRARVEGADKKTSRLLRASPKERAEHLMLVDLERNDLAKISKAGSVKVEEMMEVESYRHVHHIVSKVTGVLKPRISPAEVIAAVFPGGTITGCPKVRSMEILAETEQQGRGPYTGSMGYVCNSGNMDLNILIRTIYRQGNKAHFRAGGGIVADSKTRRELEETRAKARGLIRALVEGES